ncbi:hypothetical protein ACFQ14_12455 [Pseudahrensia aquimaris]|uniref:Uncharacterized protein n=1 Tax=Pseudahrensia aquimaris TaxID=744461 RepID=A0ABW3FIB4_9HYPH
MARLFSFHIPRWTHLTWRQQSLAIACGATFIGLTISAGVVGISQFENEQLRIWLSLTLAPFIFVVMLGIVARLQQRIDLRAGRNATLPPDQNSELRRP